MKQKEKQIVENINLTKRNIEHLMEWGRIIENSDFIWTKEDAKLYLKLKLNLKEVIKTYAKKRYTPRTI